MRTNLAIVAVVAVLALPAAAGAEVELRIARISDTSATLTFGGPDEAVEGVFAFGTPDRAPRVYLWDPFEGLCPATAYTVTDNTVATNTGNTFSSCDASGGGPDATLWRLDKHSGDYRSVLRIPFGSSVSGQTVSGSATVSCSDGAWKPVGSTGSLYFGSDGNGVLQVLTGTWVIVEATPPPPPPPSWHPGDANKDGAVDLQDFGLLKDNFGLSENATWDQGDFNADRGVDLQDFGILKDHFGHTTGDSPMTAVPEPATLGLLLAGLALRRRR